MPKQLPADLKQKIAKSVAGQGPSLVPPKPQIAPTVEQDTEEEYPQLDTLLEPGKDRTELGKLMAEYATANQSKKEMESILEGLKPRIEKIMGDYGIAKAANGLIRANAFANSRKSVDPKLLLANGVVQEVIDASTKVARWIELRVSVVRPKQ